jgi:3-methyladenine DNA glycosylase/8-oxoguanine DNA glycosylase
MSEWSLSSTPPHDWYLCLDVSSYFDFEHEPEHMFETGFIRPVPIGDRDAILTIRFNGDPESPEFFVSSKESLTSEEIDTANKHLSKILGLEMNLRKLYETAGNDPVLGPKLSEYYGLKRMTRATLFEDIQNRIVEMQMNHKPTAKKMMYRIREQYGTLLDHDGGTLAAWPRPHELMKADPQNIRALGPTLRKGQYLTGLAQDIVAGTTDMDWLTTCDPVTAYNTLVKIKGIGPTAAQDLIMMRGRPDAVFPSNRKKDQEKGLRRWIIWSYGEDPDTTTENRFLELIKSWKGYESAALEFLYLNYIMNEKEQRQKKS